MWLFFAATAILYNPIFPIYLYSKSLWVAINLGTALAIYIALKSKVTYESKIRNQSHQFFEKNKRNEPEKNFSTAVSQFSSNEKVKINANSIFKAVFFGSK